MLNVHGRRSVLAGLAVAAGSVAFLAAAPTDTTSPFFKDPQNEWVQDSLSDALGTPNTILCFMSALRADLMVNAGKYVALVDMKKCDSNSRGGSDDSSSTNSGASAQVKYNRVIVESTRASNNDAMIVKAWFTMPMGGGGGGPELSVDMYAYAQITESPSTSNPNGKFTMSFCGIPTGIPTDCVLQGELTALDGNTLSFTEKEMPPGGGSGSTRRLTITRSGDTGSGRVEFVEDGQTKGGAFSYDAAFFRRGNSANDAQCFSRTRDEGDVSTWRYGVYKADGSRADLANPGFNISATYGGQTYWGHAGFWGVFLPTVSVNGSQKNLLDLVSEVSRATPGSTSSTTYTLNKVGGKLYRMDKKPGTLSDLKGQGIMTHLQPNVVAPNDGGGQAEVSWTGSQLVIKRKMDGSGNWTAGNDAPLLASTIRTNAPYLKTLQGFSQSAGGEVQITVPSSGEFVASTSIAARSRQLVTPGSAGAPGQLACVHRCPKGNLALTDFNGGDPFQTIQVMVPSQSGPVPQSMSSQMAFGPVSTTNKITYTFPASGQLTAAGGALVDASTLSLSGMYQGGFQSGRLIDTASDVYASVRCDPAGVQGFNPSPTGSYICPWLVEEAATYYTYETGSNPWNRYVGLSAGNTAVTFDPPKIFSLNVDSTSTTAKPNSPLLGTTVRLQYNGFGDLQGIPGVCVDMRSNLPVQCGSSSGADQQFIRWVPAFSIKDKSEITEEGTSNKFYVKYLEREVRFAKVANTSCAGLTLPFSATLPAMTTTNASQLAGARPTVNDAPSVIGGIRQ